MPKLSFILDGKRVEAETGSTILEAVNQNGVELPTLCHDPRLKPYGSCRICLVEVEGARGPVPACATPLAEGMVVRTRTDDIVKLRRMALELLLSDHYGDCIAPCKRACPAGIDIQGYIGLIADGQYQEALKLIKESNPLPLVCGRVCPRFCETKCRRNLLDDPLAINALKRFAADYDQNNGGPYIPEPKPSTGRRVAIVGGGPAGLTAAYYLALEGHEVTIFDANPQLGGMLRYGIPEYRLPKAILDKEIATITGLCHQIHCNVSLGQDFSIAGLKGEGYEAIFSALGAQANQKMRVEGEDLPGVLSGVEFLRDVALGKEVNTGERVAVIGGGNTAIDAARTALRLGAREVTIVYRRSREEMPANDEEVEQAEQEEIQFHFLAAPTSIRTNNGKVDMECIRMALGEPDSSGRRRPEPIAGSEFNIGVDSVIAAIGQRLDVSGIGKDGQPELSSRGYIRVNEETMETSVEGVFAGGDCTSGPATAVEAIAAGRRAATSVNQYLNGQQIAPVKEPYNCAKGELDEIDVTEYEDVERLPRTEMPTLEPGERKINFDEIELGFTEEMAKKETERCLACGCQDVFECKLRQLATEYEVDDTRYAGRKRYLPIKKDEHRYILRDPNKCILCGRCVRICNELQGVGALGFTQRGFDTVIEPSLGMPLAETNCESCAQCISTCPTGALTPKINLPKPGPWQPEVVPTVCAYCGIGCNIELNVKGNKIVEVTSSLESPVNNGNLCKKGRFNYTRNLQDSKRLRAPLIKQDDHLIEASWEQAIAAASNGLGQIREQSGANSLAVLASPQLTNEESYLVQKLARAALGTNNISSLTASALGNELAKGFGKNASTCSYSDILNSDLILIFGGDINEEYPIIALKIREAVARGSKLITLSPRATRIDSLAEISLKVNRRISVALIKAMLNYIISHNLIDRDFIQNQTTGFKGLADEMKKYPLEKIADVLWTKPAKITEIIHLYIRARRPVIVIDADTATSSELTLISNLALITGNVGHGAAGIIALRTHGNAQGLIDMGVNPDYLPGQQPITDVDTRQRFETAWDRLLPSEKGKSAIEIIQGIERGEIRGVLAVGDEATGKIGNAVFESPGFSVLVSTVFPETPPYPDVVLPGANFAESEGTYTNCERRIQRLRRAISPPAGKENWEVISALATSLGYPMHYNTVSSIHSEIAELVPIFKIGEDYGYADKGIQWSFLNNGSFDFSDGLARLELPEFESSETLEALRGLS